MKLKRSLWAMVAAGLSCITAGSIGGEEPVSPSRPEYSPELVQYQESIGTPKDILDLEGFRIAKKTSEVYSWCNSSAKYSRYLVGGDTVVIDKNRLDLKSYDPRTEVGTETRILDLNGDGIVDEVQIRKPVKDNPGGFYVTRIVNVQGPESVVYPAVFESEGRPEKLYYEARRFAETKPDSIALKPFQRIYDLMSKKSD